MTRAEIIAAANDQADADCRRAIAAGVNAELGPEYVVSGDATGKRLLIPSRRWPLGCSPS